MGDRLLGFPIERCKCRHCYNISTHRKGCLRGFESTKRAWYNISVPLSYFVL
jgi:hypothetical protein